MIFYKDHICLIEGSYSIEIPENVHSRLQIIFLGSGVKNETVLFVTVGKNACLDLIESHLSSDNNEASILSKIEIQITENANLNFIKIININNKTSFAGSIKIKQAHDSTLKNHLLSLNGKNNSVDLNVELNGNNAKADLLGLMLADGDKIINVNTCVAHNIGHTKSWQDFRGIVNDRAMCSFTGKIVVQKKAVKSSANQLNKNIILSKKATMRSKPELQIFADDVKCSHGSSSGGLDKNALFYLKSRGINENDAKEMLINSFIGEIIKKI